MQNKAHDEQSLVQGFYAAGALGAFMLGGILCVDMLQDLPANLGIVFAQAFAAVGLYPAIRILGAGAGAWHARLLSLLSGIFLGMTGALTLCGFFILNEWYVHPDQSKLEPLFAAVGIAGAAAGAAYSKARKLIKARASEAGWAPTEPGTLP